METQSQFVSQRLTEFFDAIALNQLARETRFVQRQPVIDGQLFALAMIWGCIEEPKSTLNHWAQVCWDLGVPITAQGLNERINAHSVAFMTALFQRSLETLQQRLALPLPILEQFTAVNLVDSSYISLSPHLCAVYPGCGGAASPAGLKVQLVMDFLRGTLKHVALRPGREPDQKYRAYLETVEPGSLTIHDLGYFCLDTCALIGAEKQAYWLSRYLFGTNVYTEAGAEISLPQVLEAQTGNCIEMTVCLGAEQHLPCRLIAYVLPQEVVEQRRRRAKAQARKKGRTPSQEYLALLAWTILVTNVPATMLAAEHALTLYRVRWQIELVFKLWKSECGLAHNVQVRQARLLTELYAKLTGCVLLQLLLSPLRMPIGHDARYEISPVHLRRICKRLARTINQALYFRGVLNAVLKDIYTYSLRFGFKQQRRKKPNVCQMLALLTPAFDAITEYEVLLLPQLSLP